LRQQFHILQKRLAHALFEFSEFRHIFILRFAQRLSLNGEIRIAADDFANAEALFADGRYVKAPERERRDLDDFRNRADLMRLDSAASETTRPSQTFSMISSFETTRSRFSMSSDRSANTWGSSLLASPPARSSTVERSSSKRSNW